MNESVKKMSVEELKNYINEYCYFFILGEDLAILEHGEKIPSDLGSLGYALKCCRDYCLVVSWKKSKDGQSYIVREEEKIGDFIVDPVLKPGYVKASEVFRIESC